MHKLVVRGVFIACIVITLCIFFARVCHYKVFCNFEMTAELPFWGSLIAGILSSIAIPLSNFLTIQSNEKRVSREDIIAKADEKINKISDLFYEFHNNINGFYHGLMSDKNLEYSIDSIKWQINEENNNTQPNKELLSDLESKLKDLEKKRHELNELNNCSVAVHSMVKLKGELADVEEAEVFLQKLQDVKDGAYRLLAQDFFTALEELEQEHIAFKRKYKENCLKKIQ